jgi:hypothetical protein
MTGKVLLIVLVLIVLLFVVLAVWGNSNNKSEKSSGNLQTDVDKFNTSPHPQLLKSLGDLFSSFGPKLDPKQMQPSGTTFDLRSRPDYQINVLPDRKNKFRQANFKAVPNGCAHLLYAGHSSSAPALDAQDSDSKDNKERKLSLVIPEEGGKITVERELPRNPGPCTVQLE